MPNPVAIANFDGFASRNGSSANIDLGKPSGAFALNGSTFYASLIDNQNNFLKTFVSSDTGATWSEADSAHHPGIFNGTGTDTNGQNIIRYRSNYSISAGTTIYTAYVGTDTTVRIAEFDMTNGTWGTIHTGGPLTHLDINGGHRATVALSRRSTGDLLVAYTEQAETLSLVQYDRIGVYKLTTNTWTNLTNPTIGNGDTKNYFIYEIKNTQSDLNHIFYNKFNGTVSVLSQLPIASNDTLGTGQAIATNTATVNNFIDIYPASFRSSDNHVVLPFIFKGTPDVNRDDLQVAEATDGTSPTWTVTDLTGNSVYSAPFVNANTGLLMPSTNTNGDTYIFFAVISTDVGNNNVGLAEFNNNGNPSWNVNDAMIFNPPAANFFGAEDVSAAMLPSGTQWGLAFGMTTNSSTNFSNQTGFLLWPPNVGPKGLVWAPLNITY